MNRYTISQYLDTQIDMSVMYLSHDVSHDFMMSVMLSCIYIISHD